MPKKDLVTKVWIEEGCIVCDACETASPEVFEVQDETCVIRPEALDAAFNKARTDSIIEAAEECPTDVIKFDTVTEEVAETAPAPAAAQSEESASEPATPQEAPAVAAKAPAAPSPAKQPASAMAAKPAKAPVVSVAGGQDPAIAALLEAATSRGGSAGIMRTAASIPDSARGWAKTKMDDLPPDARQARVLEEARKMKQDPDQRRRAVAGGAAMAAGWALFAGGSVVSTVALGRFMMPNVLEEPDPRVRVGKLGRYVEMQPGGVNEDYKPDGIWMIRLESRIAALNIICTHLGCIPNWLPNDHKFKCPCHGSGYYQNGINFEGPTPRPLERFRLFVEHGLIVVDKSKKYQQELGQWDMPGSFIAV